MISVAEARPPYVSFVTRPVEDRDASIKAGQMVMRDVDYALVTPHGSKDRLEKVVGDWFATLEEAVKQERMPGPWLAAYKDHYKAWKNGQEVPVNGTSVRNWPLLSPAQVENMISLKVMTVEDLAAANEELLARLGMGARALKDKAQAWLQTAGSPGAKVAEQVSALMSENTQLKERNEGLTRDVETLKAQMASLNAPKKA